MQSEYCRINELTKRSGIGRTTIYALNKKYHFIFKVGSISLVRWADFEKALLTEAEKQA